jgi:hypothetical protein
MYYKKLNIFCVAKSNKKPAYLPASQDLANLRAGILEQQVLEQRESGHG